MTSLHHQFFFSYLLIRTVGLRFFRWMKYFPIVALAWSMWKDLLSHFDLRACQLPQNFNRQTISLGLQFSNLPHSLTHLYIEITSRVNVHQTIIQTSFLLLDPNDSKFVFFPHTHSLSSCFKLCAHSWWHKFINH